jgi:hypothetical protein
MTDGAPSVNRLTQLLLSWENGDASFDRGALAKVLALDPQPEVEAEGRMWLYKWLLMGPTKRDAPASFTSFVGTMPATTTASSPASTTTPPSIEEDVNALLARIQQPDDAKLKSEVRGVIEYLCVKTGARYETSMAQQLEPLVQASLDQAVRSPDAAADSVSLKTPFLVWHALRQGYIPAAVNLRSYREVLDILFTLVLQYHDPQLTLHLERNKVNFAACFLERWLPSLFSACADTVQATLRLWDALLLDRERDDCIIPLLGVALLSHCRESLLQATTRQDAQAALAGLRFSEADVPILAADVHRIMHRTPFSARRQLRLYTACPIDAATLSGVSDEIARLKAFVVLPVDADELTDAFACAVEGVMEPRPQHLNFVVLDCRAEKSYHHARLPTAVHVGNYIGFDPVMLQRMTAEFESARGSHLCILGTGRGMIEELNLLKIIALQFVQASFPYISFADGGFKACVPRIKAGRAEIVRTPQRQTTDSVAAGTPMQKDTSHRGGADDDAKPTDKDAAAASSRQAQLAEDAKEKLKAAQVKASENLHAAQVNATEKFQAAKTWGLGLMSRFRKTASTDDASAKATDESFPGGDVTANGHDDHKAPSPASNSKSPPRGTSVGATSNASGASPAPKKPSAYGFEGEEDDDDDDDFGLVTSIPSAKAAHAASAEPAPHAVADDEGEEAEGQTSAAVAPPSPSSADIEGPQITAANNDIPLTKTKDSAAVSPASPPTPAPALTTAKLAVTDDLDDPFGDSPLSSATKPASSKPTEATEPRATSTASTAKAASEPHPFDDIFN